MSTATKLFAPDLPEPHLRPFDVRRDLGRLADLVEQCFSDTLDPDGERYLQQMRAAARNPGFLKWASAATDWVSIPLSGYVWEEDGQLVGNLSLIPYTIQGKRTFLIANVAVHPNYRRQGIARRLTLQGIEHAQRRGAPSVWLHVRENNEGAVRLYRSLDFVEQARRTTWFSTPTVPYCNAPADIQIIPRRSQHWLYQRRWLEQTYPSTLTWHLPLNLNLLRPGLTGLAYRLFNTIEVQQWAAVRCGRLLGVLSMQSSMGYASPLWLAAGRENEDLAAQALLCYARTHQAVRRSLALDFPAHRADQAIQTAGFYAHQTLIWMAISFH